MRNQHFLKYLAPAVAAGLLLVSTHSLAQTPRPTIEDLINSCPLELQTFCDRLNGPNEAVMCLRENEPRLFTRDCIEVMKLMHRSRNNVPLPSEQPFRIPYENGGQVQ